MYVPVEGHWALCDCLLLIFFSPGLDSPPFLPFGGTLLDPKSLCLHHLSIHIDLKYKYGEVHNSYQDLICWTLEESEGCECCEEQINEYSVKGNVLIRLG
jgi:hypothetical protein